MTKRERRALEACRDAPGVALPNNPADLRATVRATQPTEGQRMSKNTKVESTDILADEHGIPHLRALIERLGPVKLPTLEEAVYPNPNRSAAAKKENRSRLDSYLKRHADVGGWIYQRKKARMPGQEDEPAQATFAAEGMGHVFKDKRIADLANAWSLSSQERADAQAHERECKQALDAALAELSSELGENDKENEERTRYTFLDAAGDVAVVYHHTEPSKTGPRIEKPAKGEQ